MSYEDLLGHSPIECQVNFLDSSFQSLSSSFSSLKQKSLLVSSKRK